MKHHRYSVNQSAANRGKPGREGAWRSARLGLLYVHCARAFTPLNTQRRYTVFRQVCVSWEPTWEREERRDGIAWERDGGNRASQPPPKWVTYLYPLCVRWTPPLTPLPAPVDLLCSPFAWLGSSQNFANVQEGSNYRLARGDRCIGVPIRCVRFLMEPPLTSNRCYPASLGTARLASRTRIARNFAFVNWIRWTNRIGGWFLSMTGWTPDVGCSTIWVLWHGCKFIRRTNYLK